MDAQKINSMLSREEGTKLDFKLKLNIETESGKKELAKDVCAIANSRGGRGHILFGIEDKTKKIIGINLDEFSEEQIQQVVSTRIDPPVPISVDTVNIDNHIIGVLTIYYTEQKPHQLRDNGAFYIRRGSTTDIMRKEEIASMLQDTGLINYELLPLYKACIDDLDHEKLLNFFHKSGLPLNINKSILLSMGIIAKEKDYNEYHPTCGGMLLFGKNPQIFLPHAIIRIHNYTNELNPEHYIASGTIIEMLNDACSYLRNNIDNKDYPFEIVEDFLGKSVIYRDYFEINSAIEVFINKNKIEITNPGAAVKETNRSLEKYVRRNMWLYLKVIALDSTGQYFNKSINLSELTQKFGKIKTFNILSKNLYKVILPLKIKQ
ncbi:ATP-binding protein [Fervidicella metallireducens AeB]|uniref:ATP-binding protein n=1 Tax=Fervidicella metallireducens AeB TaxID=1403537 RepID=A0A017RVR4_9CLOT|nr:RNA-binding domain-containing protein [Fervidicella metallireducens]EYE87985.1 ATP-binding protein [Fervidicella metallireducens AeB]